MSHQLLAFGGWEIITLLFLLIPLATIVFWIVMLIDCATHETAQDSQKVVWVLIIIFIPLLGSVLYYFIRRRPRLYQQQVDDVPGSRAQADWDSNILWRSERLRAVCVAVVIILLIVVFARLVGK